MPTEETENVHKILVCKPEGKRLLDEWDDNRDMLNRFLNLNEQELHNKYEEFKI